MDNELKESIDKLNENIETLTNAISSIDETINETFGTGNFTDMLSSLIHTMKELKEVNASLLKTKD